ncbi:MAG: hypothetical protein LW629_06290 [Burkholderiales bacterium]|nr:hypothetical protein [Burkholderiales bacterium]
MPKVFSYTQPLAVRRTLQPIKAQSESTESRSSETATPPYKALRQLNNWLTTNNFQAPARVRVIPDKTGMGRWLFQDLEQRSGYLVESAAPMTLLKLLAPFASVHTKTEAQQLRGHLQQAGIPEHLPFVNAVDAKKLLKSLFGNDFQESGKGRNVFPGSPKDMRAWAACFQDGNLWFSTEDWLDGGAFHIQMPQWIPGKRPETFPTFHFGWDQGLRKYTDHAAQGSPTVLTWPRRDDGFEDHFTAPEQPEPLLAQRGLVHNLMTHPTLELLHLIDHPRAFSDHQPIQITLLPKATGRAHTSFYAGNSAVMSRAESWLSAMRFQTAFPRQAAQADKLLSLLQTSLSSIPLQQRLLSFLMKNEELQQMPDSLVEFYEKGELLLDDMRTLLACNTLVANTRAAGGSALELNAPDTLHIWVTQNKANKQGHNWPHELHYYVNSPALFTQPVLLTQAIGTAEANGSWQCGPLNMIVGADPGRLQVKGPSISLQLDPDEDTERLAQMQDRATAQSNFWGHILRLEAGNAGA